MILLILHFNNAFVCHLIVFRLFVTTLWDRQVLSIIGWGTGGLGRFFCDISLKFIPQNDGARIQWQNFWLQVQSSLLHTLFLIFLLALYLTMKGVEMNLKVTSFWLVIKSYFFFITVTQKVTLIIAFPKKTLLLSFAVPLVWVTGVYFKYHLIRKPSLDI